MNLSQRVGPLPLGGWIAVVGGGTVLGLYLRARRADANAAATAAATQTAVAAPSGLSGVSSTAVTDASTFSPDATTADSTSNPYGVTTTYNNDIGTYVAEQTNTSTSTSVGTENVTNQAAAPARTIFQISDPPPSAQPSAPAPAQTAVRQVNNGSTTYVVRPGDTYWGLAQRYYGSGLLWPKIQAVNPYPPTKIPVGATLTIPA